MPRPCPPLTMVLGPGRPVPARAGTGVRAGRLAALLAATVLSGPGCASLDEGVFFPAGYQESFTKVHDCKKSAHPAGDYVVVWINEAGREAFEAGTTPLPEGTVLVKTQYSDAACSRLARYTAMEKGAAGSDPERGDWRWQLVRDDGSLASCCTGGEPSSKDSCTGCHKGCSSNDWVCTQP